MNNASTDQEIIIGVFVCDCGLNIVGESIQKRLLNTPKRCPTWRRCCERLNSEDVVGNVKDRESI